MPVLGGLLTSLFVQLAELFALYVGRKLAAAAAGIAVFGAITATLFVALAATVQALFVALPANSAVLTGVWIAVPDNGPACIATALAAELALTVYRMNVMNVQFGVYAS